MRNVLGNVERTCQGMRRRRLLQAAGAGLFGMKTTTLLAAEEARRALGAGRYAEAGIDGRPPFVAARAKSVIFLLLFGGPSQLETFDLKPDAPSAIRGPFKPIACRTPGLLIGEHLPRLAAVSDRFSVLRTVGHPYNDHSTGGHYIQTGHPWHIPIGAGFNATARDWPSVGSVCDYLAQATADPGDRLLPNYAFLPNRLGALEEAGWKRPGQYGGWLGKAFDPIATRIPKRNTADNPYFRPCTDAELDFQFGDLVDDAALTVDRLDGRRRLVEQFDAVRKVIENGPMLDAFDRNRRKAYGLASSTAVRSALDVTLETNAVRDAYGRGLFGQSTLTARRLVEAGVRYVTIGWDAVDGYGWDSHLSSDDVKNHLLPGFDQALAALLVDLEQRGLLDETRVVAMGEMGRTPKAANGRWGRNHWSFNFPVVLAGAGIRGGTVYGKSDKDAAYAVDKPLKPEDVAATLYWALGMSPDLRLPDPQGRPTAMVEGGRPLIELFG
ncbi:MAG: DUF1501 domain-containing protein [Planctomycetia bacterium]